MQQNRPVRVVKRGEKARGDENITKTTDEHSAKSSERELKAVVSGWVREHRQRSEQYRRAVSEMLRESGMRPSGAPSLA